LHDATRGWERLFYADCLSLTCALAASRSAFRAARRCLAWGLLTLRASISARRSSAVASRTSVAWKMTRAPTAFSPGRVLLRVKPSARMVQEMDEGKMDVVVAPKASLFFVDTSPMWIEKFIATAQRRWITLADADSGREYDLRLIDDEAAFRASGES